MQSILELKHEQKGGELVQLLLRGFEGDLGISCEMTFLAEPLQEAFAWSHTVSYPCMGDCIIVKRNEEKLPFLTPK